MLELTPTTLAPTRISGWAAALAAVAPALAQAPMNRAPMDGNPHSLERALGWRPLFDGSSHEGWIRFGGEAFPTDGWSVEDGCLRHTAGGGGGDIVHRDLFEDFELEFDWRVGPGANSGVKYRVIPVDKPGSMLGPEYQVLDDGSHRDGANPLHAAAALYDLIPAENKNLVRVLEAGASGRPPFNHGRVLARGSRLEHWLNGQRTVAIDLESDAWGEALGKSKFKARPSFAQAAPGHIGFQDHGDDAWFKNVRIRDHGNLPGDAVALYNGTSLAGWRSLGDANYVPGPGGILGEVGGGGQSFLITEREYGDFILEVDVRTEMPGNSGIQIRSHTRERNNGTERLYGYQVEIDPSDRSWSGGLYEEACPRGWIQSLEDNPAAREAFRFGEWNHFRIECVGPWIRTWINGVPAADVFDVAELSGVIGLQVHSGNNTRVRWNDFHLQDLGTRTWRPLFGEASTATWTRGDEALWSTESGITTATVGERMALDEFHEDFCLCMEFDAAKGHPLIRWQHGKSPDGATHGWFFDLSQEGFASEFEEGWNEVAVMSYGLRRVLLIGGRVISDVTYEGPHHGPGRLVLEVSGHDPIVRVPLRNVRILGPAE